MEESLQCIMSPILAKQLILKGYVVKDIKPNKNFINGTVFLFEKSAELNQEINLFKKSLGGK